MEADPHSPFPWGFKALTPEIEWLLLGGNRRWVIRQEHGAVVVLADTHPHSPWSLSAQAAQSYDGSFARHFTPNHKSGWLKPGLPTKPLMVRLPTGVVLAPKHSLTCGIVMPATLRWCDTESKPESLFDLPSTQLPDAWWGDENGEPCSLLDTDLRLVPPSYPASPMDIFCPLVLINPGDEPLRVQQFMIWPEHLHLYLSEAKGLVCDQISIRLREQATESASSVARPDAAFWGPLQVMQLALAPPVEQLIKRGFDFLRSFY